MSRSDNVSCCNNLLQSQVHNFVCVCVDTGPLCVLQVKILSSIITAILPGIVLTIFLALMPTILALLNKKVQKMVSETDVEFGVVRKYFAFQVSSLPPGYRLYLASKPGLRQCANCCLQMIS